MYVSSVTPSGCKGTLSKQYISTPFQLEDAHMYLLD